MKLDDRIRQVVSAVFKECYPGDRFSIEYVAELGALMHDDEVVYEHAKMLKKLLSKYMEEKEKENTNE